MDDNITIHEKKERKWVKGKGAELEEGGGGRMESKIANNWEVREGRAEREKGLQEGWIECMRVIPI